MLYVYKVVRHRGQSHYARLTVCSHSLATNTEIMIEKSEMELRMIFLYESDEKRSVSSIFGESLSREYFGGYARTIMIHEY